MKQNQRRRQQREVVAMLSNDHQKATSWANETTKNTTQINRQFDIIKPSRNAPLRSRDSFT